MRASATSGRSSHWRKQPAAHRRHRPVDHVEQRSAASAFGAFDDVQVTKRDRIDEQAIGGDVQRRRRARARASSAACRADTLTMRAGRGDGGRRVLEAVTGERGGLKLLAERVARARVLERPRIDARDAARRERRSSSPSTSASSAASSSLGLRTASSAAGPRSFVGNSAAAKAPVETSRKASPHERFGVTGRHGRKKRRLARVEIRRVGERARRDDARDFALDEALRVTRVFDLIADRDAIARAARGGRDTCRRRETARRTSEWRRPSASFARDVSVSSSTRDAVSASS